MDQKKKERIGFLALAIGGTCLSVGNLIFIFYCISFFFDNMLGKGAAVPAVLLYLFLNVVIILIITEIFNWSLE